MEQKLPIAKQENSEDTMLKNCLIVPAHLVGKVTTADYAIYLANNESSIGKIIKTPHFQVNSFLDELGKIFMQVIGDLGIKNLPSKAAEQRIIYYIIHYYKDFSLQEIRKAFELAIIGEMEVDAEHYHSFDIKYICKILNAYRKRRIKSKELVKRNTPRIDNLVTEEQKQDRREGFIKTICSHYEKYKETNEWGHIPLATVYDFFVEEGIIKDQKKVKKEAVVMSFFKKCILKSTDFDKLFAKST